MIWFTPLSVNVLWWETCIQAARPELVDCPSPEMGLGCLGSRKRHMRGKTMDALPRQQAEYAPEGDWVSRKRVKILRVDIGLRQIDRPGFCFSALGHLIHNAAVSLGVVPSCVF